MLKSTTVIVLLLLVSIVTYYVYEQTIATEPTDNVVWLSWGALVVSTITFVLAIVGLLQKAKGKSQAN